MVSKNLPTIPNEKIKGNEESVVELVQNDHEIVLERIRFAPLLFIAHDIVSSFFSCYIIDTF